jgi:hypothetical protein
VKTQHLQRIGHLAQSILDRGVLTLASGKDPDYVQSVSLAGKNPLRLGVEKLVITLHINTNGNIRVSSERVMIGLPVLMFSHDNNLL